MADILLGTLDWLQGRLWRIGVRFQWPCWLLAYAWDRRARLDCPAEPYREKAVRAKLGEDGNHD